MRGVALLLLLPSLTHTALPPGYDEELFCPPDACLRHRARPQGWSGPRSDFHECAYPALTGAKPTRPHSWGVKVGAEVRQDLVDRGWHTDVCEESGVIAPHEATGTVGQISLMAEALLSRAMRVHALLDKGVASVFK